ncbi:hypothetical protein WIW50_07135 [Flavobacteriaceae bacterium 3-367]|uniref:hypothetical protein n=1 Tax=Eudoraea algarum TaxID=3417568 RepID=UPI00329163E0
MFRYFSHLLLSFLLAGSILMPSVITLLDFEAKVLMVMDFGEEENKKKEGKKEYSEKEVFFHSHLDPANFLGKEGANAITFYASGCSDFIREIHLPPPEHII